MVLPVLAGWFPPPAAASLSRPPQGNKAFATAPQARSRMFLLTRATHAFQHAGGPTVRGTMTTASFANCNLGTVSQMLREIPFGKTTNATRAALVCVSHPMGVWCVSGLVSRGSPCTGPGRPLEQISQTLQDVVQDVPQKLLQRMLPGALRPSSHTRYITVAILAQGKSQAYAGPLAFFTWKT